MEIHDAAGALTRGEHFAWWAPVSAEVEKRGLAIAIRPIFPVKCDWERLPILLGSPVAIAHVPPRGGQLANLTL